jgi:RNA polymerase sigma-70 factor (ECF subfamily)
MFYPASNFNFIYKRFYAPILAHVSRRVKDTETAKEITQDIFIKIFRFGKTFDSSFQLSVWIWTIARNTLSDWFRKNSKMLEKSRDSTPTIDVEEIPCIAPTPELALFQKTERNSLRRTISNLTGLQKKVLIMRLVYQLPFREIARALDLSVSSVKSLMQRGKTTLLLEK